jgi:hypothetical protein
MKTDWNELDWTRTNMELAISTGRSRNSVRRRRKALGKPESEREKKEQGKFMRWAKRSAAAAALLLAAACGKTEPAKTEPALPLHYWIILEDPSSGSGFSTYRLVRPQGKVGPDGSFEAEIWSKDGVPTNEYVYLRTVMAGGRDHFTRVSP